MTKHLKYLVDGVLYICVLAGFVALAVSASMILLLPAFLYGEIGISWALWLYAIYLLAAGYIVGRLSEE